MKKRYTTYENIEKAGEYRGKSFDVTASELGYNELRQAVASMSKTANQRLRQLERSGGTEQPAYKAVERLYNRDDKAVTTTQAGELKFNTNTRAQTLNELRHEFSNLQKFLTAQTSTVRGITDKYKRSAETLNERYGTNLTVQEVGDLFATETFRQWASQHGSGEALKEVKRLSLDKLTIDDIEYIFASDKERTLQRAVKEVERRHKQIVLRNKKRNE